MNELTVKYNELTAEELALLWESVWGIPPALEQIKLAMKNTMFRVSVNIPSFVFYFVFPLDFFRIMWYTIDERENRLTNILEQVPLHILGGERKW